MNQHSKNEVRTGTQLRDKVRGLVRDELLQAAESIFAEEGLQTAKVESIAARAAITVDPELAEREREHAERNRARVFLKRERSGAASAPRGSTRPSPSFRRSPPSGTIAPAPCRAVSSKCWRWRRAWCGSHGC